jgi:ankyrin repeat protein
MQTKIKFEDLFDLVKNGQAEQIRDAIYYQILDETTDFYKSNYSGYDLLSFAEIYGTKEKVKILEEAADVKDSLLSLYDFIEHEDFNSVDRLLSNQVLPINFSDNDHHSALYYAVMKDCGEIVERITKYPNCDLNIRSKFGDTPIILAARNGSLDVLKILIEAGGDVNLKNSHGDTALHVATRLGKDGEEIVSFLCAFPGCDVNVQNSLGDTALHVATRLGEDREEIVSFLCASPLCDVNVQNFHGDTPAMLAVRNVCIHMFIQLVGFGSDLSIKNSIEEDVLSISQGSMDLGDQKIIKNHYHMQGHQIEQGPKILPAAAKRSTNEEVNNDYVDVDNDLFDCSFSSEEDEGAVQVIGISE